MKKRIFGIIMLLMLLVAVPALADSNTAPIVDWGQILTTALYGLLGVAAAFVASVIVYAVARYVLPALPGIVQWLSDKRLLWLARILVNAAEVALGRYLGAEKRALVKQWLKDRGITITENVEIMISNAWTELNNKMIELGLKDAQAPEISESEAALADDPE
jgi:type IV secretory pathway VirB2 component (pilin)